MSSAPWASMNTKSPIKAKKFCVLPAGVEPKPVCWKQKNFHRLKADKKEKTFCKEKTDNKEKKVFSFRKKFFVKRIFSLPSVSHVAYRARPAFNALLPRGAQHPLGPQGKLSKDQYGKEEL